MSRLDSREDPLVESYLPSEAWWHSRTRIPINAFVAAANKDMAKGRAAIGDQEEKAGAIRRRQFKVPVGAARARLRQSTEKATG